MIRVKLTTPTPEIPLILQTPNSSGILGNYQFFINDNEKNVDWWVVVDRMIKRESVICPPQNTILITQETELTKTYEQKFLDQFNWVLTCQRQMNHPRKIFSQQGYGSYLFLRRRYPDETMENWRAQFKKYAELNTITDIPKTKLISVVTSHKLNNPGAILRKQFIIKMKEHFGDQFDMFSNKPDVFGPDTKVEKIKWNAVAPYKYHLAIENNVVPHYWTDKILDAYLAGAYPIYYGDPSVLDYFPKNSLTLIDISDIPACIKTIEKVISENYYEKYKKEIWGARKLCLEKYNIFQTIIDTIESLPSSGIPEPITLKPEALATLKIKRYLITQVNKIPFVRTIAKKIYRNYRKIRYNQKFND